MQENRTTLTIDPDSPYAFLAKLPPELVTPLMRSDPRYLEAALNEMESEQGSVENYVRNTLGVTDEDLATIRTRLLE